MEPGVQILQHKNCEVLEETGFALVPKKGAGSRKGKKNKDGRSHK